MQAEADPPEPLIRTSNRNGEQQQKIRGVKKKHLTPEKVSVNIGKVMLMEKIVRQTLLYDFYGELLTERQKEIYESVIRDDLSLSEAAEEFGISRQGVHDMIRRCDTILGGYESKLKLVERFLNIRSEIQKIKDIAINADADEIAAIAESVLEEL